MSNKSTPSPRQRPANQNQVDESQLPAGHCRYILLLPEVKGQRCGCAHFNLNRNTPGAICECGHLSCYHVSNGEPLSTSENQELSLIKQRLELLEREHVELHQLRRDFMMLQERISQDHDRHREAIVRVSELEEQVEKVRNEVKDDVREAYHNLGRAWDSITDLMHSKKMAESHFRHITERLHDIDNKVSHIGERQLELVDTDISLEGRIEDLEELEDRIEALEENEDAKQESSKNGSRNSHSNGSSSRHRTRASVPPPECGEGSNNHSARSRPLARSPSPAYTLDPSTPKAVSSSLSSTREPANAVTFPEAATPTDASSSTPSSTSGHDRSASSTKAAAPSSTLLPPAVIAVRSAARANQITSNELWTVHVSLLPTSTRPFPFERDTNAYKRCLSRGLHQMVAVDGSSADAFEQAITKSFGHILRGRKWAPLQALPCTAETLAGLPMLRPLDPSLLDERFDQDFLRNNCAVCDINGKIDSLYIAMRDRTLSWHSIRRLPVHIANLEPCWGFDSLLDANDPFVEDEYENDVNSSEDEVMGGMPRPSAGDIVATIPSLKRAASEMSRSSSFGSATVSSACAPGAATGAAPTPAAATTSTSIATATTSAAEGEGSRPKVPRIYPLPNIVEVRRGVKTS